MPPDLRDWVAPKYLVHFVIDAMDEVDTRLVVVNQRGTGSEEYPPSMLLALLVYSYATGVFSSCQIERSMYENVAVRMLCVDTHPDHDTLCVFRRRNAALLSRAFARVLELAARCGVLKAGAVGRPTTRSNSCPPWTRRASTWTPRTCWWTAASSARRR